MLGGMGGTTKKHIALLGTEAAVLGLGAVIGDVVGYALIAAGTMAVAGTWLWPLLSKRFSFGRGNAIATSPPELMPDPEKAVPLREAGIQLFNGASTERRDFAQNTAQMSGPDEPLTGYFERMIIVAAKEGLIQLQGRRSPEVILEPISQEELIGQIYKGNGNIGSNSFTRDCDWYDLHIPAGDIVKVQDLIGDEARRSAAFRKYY